MGRILTGDQVREFSRKLGEIHRQVGQAEYPFDPERALLAIQAISEGRFDLSGSMWAEFFGHLRILDSDFNEANFPLGVDPGDEVEEFDFGRDIMGHAALPQQEWASPWAIGRYIRAYPKAQKAHPLVGIGAQWVVRYGFIWFPIFNWNDDKPYVNLNNLDNKFNRNCRFLRKKC